MLGAPQLCVRTKRSARRALQSGTVCWWFGVRRPYVKNAVRVKCCVSRGLFARFGGRKNHPRCQKLLQRCKIYSFTRWICHFGVLARSYSISEFCQALTSPLPKQCALCAPPKNNLALGLKISQIIPIGWVDLLVTGFDQIRSFVCAPGVLLALGIFEL